MRKIKFGEIRNLLSKRDTRFSIYNRQTKEHENFCSPDNIPKYYDDLYVERIGVLENKFYEIEGCEIAVAGASVEIIVSKAFGDIWGFRRVSYPRFSSEHGLWMAITPRGLQMGSLQYVMSEICLNEECDNTCAMSIPEDKLVLLVQNPAEFSISDFENEFSPKQLNFLSAAKKKLLEIKAECATMEL